MNSRVSTHNPYVYIYIDVHTLAVLRSGSSSWSEVLSTWVGARLSSVKPEKLNLNPSGAISWIVFLSDANRVLCLKPKDKKLIFTTTDLMRDEWNFGETKRKTDINNNDDDIAARIRYRSIRGRGWSYCTWNTRRSEVRRWKIKSKLDEEAEETERKHRTTERR